MTNTDSISFLQQDRAHVKAMLAELVGTGERAAELREGLLADIVAAFLANPQIEELYYFGARAASGTNEELREPGAGTC